MTPRSGRTPKKPEEWQPKFLKAFAQYGTVKSACQAANIARTTAYLERKTNPTFAEKWAQTEEEATDQLEEAALLEATVARNPTLLMFLLKARRAQVYGDRDSKEEPLRVQVEAMLRAVHEIPPAAQKQLLTAYESELGVQKTLET